MIHLSEEQLQIIYAHGQKTYPEECCGILFGHFTDGGKTVVAVMPTENAWEGDTAEDFPGDSQEYSKRRRYAIAPQVMLQAQKQAREQNIDIIGFYHSHPDYPATPSEFDRLCAWQEYSYIIVAIENGVPIEMNSWCLDTNHLFQPEKILNLGKKL
ncbi:Mov34/MPN/PAD-1 family protein [Calothrix rhizosoleniae]|uniref:Mov34/MPN/PAD-1 family protein n=1 Tax=Calothrix rhizosoleniae TaxID=888997 RepID=UPI000B49BA40|nr:M67 family metallopeptidase [Calothrix rhizosoleniae]